MNQKCHENHERNGKERELLAAFLQKGVSDNLVRGDNQDCVTEHANDGKCLDQFEVIAERVTEMVPRKCEITVRAEHFNRCKENGEEDKQVRLAFDL